MRDLWNKYVKGDGVLWTVFLILCVISTMIMYSASSQDAWKSENYNLPILKHFGFILGGVVIALIVGILPKKIINKIYLIIRIAAYAGIFVSFFLLIIAFFKHTRWLWGFQPSEIAKLCLIIVTADLISRIKNREKDEKKYFKAIMYVSGIICGLILPINFSTGFLLFGVLLLMIIIGGISWKRWFCAIVAVLLLAAGVYGLTKILPTQLKGTEFKRAYIFANRIDDFFGVKTENDNLRFHNLATSFRVSNNDTIFYTMYDNVKEWDAETNEWKTIDSHGNKQEIDAKIAIVKSNWRGVGFGNSQMRDYLAAGDNDFIYAIILEEGGLLAGIFVIFLYLWLLYRAGRITSQCSNVFPAIMVIGLVLMIVIQAFVNMAVATGFIPLTGQPLPIISRGGTSMLISCVYFGIILGVTRQIQAEKEKEETIPVVDLDEM